MWEISLPMLQAEVDDCQGLLSTQQTELERMTRKVTAAEREAAEDRRESLQQLEKVRLKMLLFWF
jgi:hypothetical protein